MSDDVTHVVMCTPVDMPSGISGTTQSLADCGHEVWLAPATRLLMLDPGVKVETQCVRCVDPELLRKAVAEERMREVPGQRAELEEAGLSQEETEHMFKALNVKPLWER